MIITNEKEKEILRIYNKIFEFYFGGNINAFVDYLADDCFIFGSSEKEVFFNKNTAVYIFQTFKNINRYIFDFILKIRNYKIIFFNI